MSAACGTSSASTIGQLTPNAPYDVTGRCLNPRTSAVCDYHAGAMEARDALSSRAQPAPPAARIHGVETARAIVNAIEWFDSVWPWDEEAPTEPEWGDIMLQPPGRLELTHADGYRIGWVVIHDDQTVFELDYAERGG